MQEIKLISPQKSIERNKPPSILIKHKQKFCLCSNQCILRLARSILLIIPLVARRLRMAIAKPVIPWCHYGGDKCSTLILAASSRDIRLGWENLPQRHLNIATSSTSRWQLTPSACKRVVPGFEDQERPSVRAWERLVITWAKERRPRGLNAEWKKKILFGQSLSRFSDEEDAFRGERSTTDWGRYSNCNYGKVDEL